MPGLHETISVEGLDFEYMFIASLFTDSESARKDCAWLTAEHFSNSELGKVWQEIVAGKTTVDAVADSPEMIKVSECVSQLPPLTRPDQMARKIYDYFFMRLKLEQAQGVIGAVVSRDVAQITEASQVIGETSLDLESPIRTLLSVDEEFRVEIYDKDICVPTYIDAIDKKYGGAFKKELLVLAARPGVGKTAFTADWARRAALAKHKVLFLSLEMARTKLWGRMVCGETKHSYNDLRLGDLDGEAKAEIECASAELVSNLDGCLIIEDRASALTTMHKMVSAVNPDIIFVDHLREIYWPYPSEKEVSWFGKALKYMRDHFALGGPQAALVVVHQLSRSFKERTDKRPLLTDLRGSGEIEQLCDQAWMPYRDDIYEEKNLGEDVIHVPIEIWNRKNRFGSLGHVNVNYNLKAQRFHALTDNRMIGNFGVDDDEEVGF